jgi:hypothetical protein
LTHLAVLKSIVAYLESGGGSRGSYLVVDPQGEQIGDSLLDFSYQPERESLRSQILEYHLVEDRHVLTWRDVREIPPDTFWFENVWNAYRNNEFYP